MVQQFDDKEGVRLLLRPNRSLSWRGNLWLWLGLTMLSLIVVTGMTLAGAWLVIPFSGLELGALAAGLYYTSRACHRQEVVILTPENIRLEKGIHEPDRAWQWPRRYARLRVQQPRHHWSPPKLTLSYRLDEIPLAPFLNERDTRKLLSILERNGVSTEVHSRFETYWF